MSKKISPQSNSINQQNPNNIAFQLSLDNRSRQLNPNNDEYKLNQDNLSRESKSLVTKQF
jgi:hypothetical protein